MVTVYTGFLFFLMCFFLTVSNFWLMVLRTDVFSLSRNRLRSDVILFRFVIHLDQRCFRIGGWFRNTLLKKFF